MWLLIVAWGASLAVPGTMSQSSGSCSAGFSVVSFDTVTVTDLAPAVCAVTDQQEVTSLSGLAVDTCSNRCAAMRKLLIYCKVR